MRYRSKDLTWILAYRNGRAQNDSPGSPFAINTIGLNTKFWLDQGGTPHTEQLHLVERWTRTNFTTLRREITITDPGTFTRPFTIDYTATLSEPGSDIMEYICIENNRYGLAQGLHSPNVEQNIDNPSYFR